MVDEVRATLQKALGRLTAQKADIDRQITAIGTALGALGGRPRSTGARRGRKRMSASARKAISARMKAYWGKKRKAKSKPE